MNRILFVSNDQHFKVSIDATLKYLGFDVLIASDSSEAWKYLNEIRFNFLLVDYQLEKESGLALYRSIRKSGTTTPVIMIGEGAFDEFMLKDFSAADYDYVLKPVEACVLTKKIKLMQQVYTVAQSLICKSGPEIHAS